MSLFKISNLNNTKNNTAYIQDLPPFLFSKYLKTLFYAAAVFFFGILICVTGLLPNVWYLSAIPTTLVAISLVAVGIWFRRSALKGYDTYIGICADIQISRSNIRLRKDVTYLIDCDSIYLRLKQPVKGNPTIPIGARVTVYAPKDTPLIDSNGVKELVTCWGYEISAASQ